MEQQANSLFSSKLASSFSRLLTTLPSLPFSHSGRTEQSAALVWYARVTCLLERERSHAHTTRVVSSRALPRTYREVKPRVAETQGLERTSPLQSDERRPPAGLGSCPFRRHLQSGCELCLVFGDSADGRTNRRWAVLSASRGPLHGFLVSSPLS